MFERMRRGWGIVKASWAVLKQHPNLLVLPVLSGIGVLLLLGSIAATVLPTVQNGSAEALFGYLENDYLVYALAFAFYWVTSFIVIFFNAALIFCALEAFAGRTPTVTGGIATAATRLPQILVWSFITATVGLALNVLQKTLREKIGFLGSLLGGFLSVAWAIVTYFVVPVLVVDRVGPIEAIKRSGGILKRTWGESLAGEGGLGIISFLLMLPVFGLVALAALTGGGVLTAGGGAGLLVFGGVVALYVIAVAVLLTALGTIFRAGAYIYATTGSAPGGMDQTLLEHTFRKKDQKT
ncbi:MAG: DUF6159 family protein [Hyphomicrobiaceae bacterium]